jgi:hypothetical protein
VLPLIQQGAHAAKGNPCEAWGKLAGTSRPLGPRTPERNFVFSILMKGCHTPSQQPKISWPLEHSRSHV